MAHIPKFRRVQQKVISVCGLATSASAAESSGMTSAMLLNDVQPLGSVPPGLIFFCWGLTFLASYNIYLAATASWQLWRQPQRLQQVVEKWSYVAGFTVRPRVFVTSLWAGLGVMSVLLFVFIQLKRAGLLLATY